MVLLTYISDVQLHSTTLCTWLCAHLQAWSPWSRCPFTVSGSQGSHTRRSAALTSSEAIPLFPGAFWDRDNSHTHSSHLSLPLRGRVQRENTSRPLARVRISPSGSLGGGGEAAGRWDWPGKLTARGSPSGRSRTCGLSRLKRLPRTERRTWTSGTRWCSGPCGA